MQKNNNCAYHWSHTK